MDLGLYQLDVDAEATQRAYVRLPLVRERCTCQHCQNFAAAISLQDQSVLGFFASLGIDAARAAEAFGSYQEEENAIDYIGYYHIVGRIAGQKEALYHTDDDEVRVLNQNMELRLTDSFSVLFTTDCSLVPEGFPEPYFQMEIHALLPWVLPLPHFSNAIRVSRCVRIQEQRAVLIQKQEKDRHFAAGTRYEFIFTAGNRRIRVYVSRRVFGHYQTGWRGIIEYAGRQLLSMREDVSV